MEPEVFSYLPESSCLKGLQRPFTERPAQTHQGLPDGCKENLMNVILMIQSRSNPPLPEPASISGIAGNSAHEKPVFRPVLGQAAKQTKRVAGKLVLPAFLLSLTPLLAGCAATNLSSLLPSSPFSSKQKKPAVPTQVAAAPASTSSPVTAPTEATAQTANLATNRTGCPKFRVWDAGRHLTLYVPGQTGDPKAIYHQASILKTARECHPGAGGISVKLGIAGRLLLGPKGRPAKIRLPLRVHLFDNKSQKVKTRKYTLFVKLSGGRTAGQFSVVERFAFTPRPGTSPAAYRIYVEFDKSTPGAG